jgi:hypothetical protein
MALLKSDVAPEGGAPEFDGKRGPGGIGLPATNFAAGEMFDGLRSAVRGEDSDALHFVVKESDANVPDLQTKEIEEEQAKISDISAKLGRKEKELTALRKLMLEAGDLDNDGRRESSPDSEFNGQRGRLGLDWQREVAIRNRTETWNARQARLIAQKRLQFDVAKLQEERRLAEARSERLAKLDMERVEEYKLRVKTDMMNKARNRYIKAKEDGWLDRKLLHDANLKHAAQQQSAELERRIEAQRAEKLADFNQRLDEQAAFREYLKQAQTAKAAKVQAARKEATERELEKLADYHAMRQATRRDIVPSDECCIERFPERKDDRDAKREQKIREREAARNAKLTARWKASKERPLVGLGTQLQGTTESAVVRGDISLYYLSSVCDNRDTETSSEVERII